MKVFRKLGLFVVLPAIAIMMMFSVATADPTTIWGHFPTAADVAPDNALEETRTSLGGFIIKVAMPHKDLFTGWPNYDPAVRKLKSPLVMHDPATLIGMSVRHYDADIDDAGCPVGLGGNQVMIGDGSFVNLPGGYHNAGAEEVHTNIISMDLTDGNGNFVRAGMAFGLGTNPGEVQSKSGVGLPGKSFFDISVVVTLADQQVNWGGGDMLLRNDWPLFLRNDDVDSLPPYVVYVHESSIPVPIYFLEDNPPHWNKDDFLGSLILAGHGMGFGPDKNALFWEILDQPGNYIVAHDAPKVPALNEWGLLLLLALLLGTGIWVAVRRRRRLKAGI